MRVIFSLPDTNSVSQFLRKNPCFSCLLFLEDHLKKTLFLCLFGLFPFYVFLFLFLCLQHKQTKKNIFSKTSFFDMLFSATFWRLIPGLPFVLFLLGGGGRLVFNCVFVGMVLLLLLFCSFPLVHSFSVSRSFSFCFFSSSLSRCLLFFLFLFIVGHNTWYFFCLSFSVFFGHLTLPNPSFLISFVLGLFVFFFGGGGGGGGAGVWKI